MTCVGSGGVKGSPLGIRPDAVVKNTTINQSDLLLLSGIRGGDEKSGGEASAAPIAQNAAAAASMISKKKGENDKENNNAGDDNGDWKGSDRTLEEILEVDTFAADNLIEFARKKEVGDGGERRRCSAAAARQRPPRILGGRCCCPWLRYRCATTSMLRRRLFDCRD